jgi:hypothetical protein
MNDRESLAEAAKRQARERSFAGEVKRAAPALVAVEAMEVEDDDGNAEDAGSYGYLRGVRERADHLEFRRKRGAWPAPGYAWLLKPIFDPDGSITLLYASGDIFVVRGRNLRPLFERILRHQALWIQEQGPEWRSQGSDSLTAIYAIEYTAGEASDAP